MTKENYGPRLITGLIYLASTLKNNDKVNHLGGGGVGRRRDLEAGRVTTTTLGTPTADAYCHSGRTGTRVKLEENPVPVPRFESEIRYV